MESGRETVSTELLVNQREWFCLRAQNKREHIAAAMLNQVDSIEAFCPRIRRFKKTRTGKKRFIEALFPGYLFARFHLADQYRRIIHTSGITYIVGHDVKRAIPDTIIDQLKADLPNEGIIDAPDVSVQPGVDIEVLTGSLQGLRGKVLALLPADKRVEILLEILGREIKVAISAQDIHVAPES